MSGSLRWPVLVTLVGWLLLVRGAVRILLPETIMGYAAKLLGNKQLIATAGVVSGLLGLVFCYYGYSLHPLRSAS